MVNLAGQRFVNESAPTLEFQQAMRDEHNRMGGAIPAWIVFDAGFAVSTRSARLAPGEAVPGRAPAQELAQRGVPEVRPRRWKAWPGRSASMLPGWRPAARMNE